jgi:hypothetical protein
MPDGKSRSGRAGDKQKGSLLTAPVSGIPVGAEATTATKQSSDSRLLRIGYDLIAVNLWLRTAILTAISVGLIVLSFHWQVITRPTIPSFLASQLGTGLLVGAVGAALVQAFVMSAPQKMQEFMDELQSQPREATLESRLAELTAELRSHDLRTRTVAGDVLGRLGVLDVFTSAEDTMAGISAALSGPTVTEIRLLGLSLSTWFGGRRHSHGADWPGRQLERLLLEAAPESVRHGGLHVRILLLDPASLSLRLLTHGTGSESTEELERLRNEIHETADHLSTLGREVAHLHNGNSLQVRFYPAVPAFFLFAARPGVFMRSYYHGLAADSRAVASAAVWHFSADSATYQATCRHFDAIWDTDSVPCEDSLGHKSIGTDQGIGESGIINIYTARDSAQQRIQWLISHARKRVWIQGVSLSHHLSQPLEDSILRLLRSPNIDTRILILDPDSDQAIRKSYRDYLLDQDGSTPIDYDKYAQDAHLHHTSDIYGRLRHSAQRFRSMSLRAAAANFQVRQYACAPTSYILIADDHVLIEQFHYGKPVDVNDSIHAQLQLAREMPLIEYIRPGSHLFPPKPGLNPLAVIENHFIQVFEHFGSPLPPS